MMDSKSWKEIVTDLIDDKTLTIAALVAIATAVLFRDKIEAANLEVIKNIISGLLGMAVGAKMGGK